MRQRDRRCWILVAVFGTVTFLNPSAADVVYLNDGHALHGKVTQQMEVIIDPATGQPIPIVKDSPCFIVDDRARFTLFGQSQVSNPDKETNIFDGHVLLKMPVSRVGKTRPGEASIGEATPFNDKWERQVNITIRQDLSKLVQPGEVITQANRFKTVHGKIKQKISLLSPHFLRVESMDLDWTANYLTSEFGPKIVLPLVRNHPDIQGKPGEPPEFDRQFTVFRFCTQAGWLDEARQELDELKKAFPDQMQKLDTAAKGLRRLIQQRLWQDAELASRVGRHRYAQQTLQQLIVSELPTGLQTDAANLRARYTALQTKLDQTRQALAMCYGRFVGPPVDFVADALPVICRELDFDNLDRLEPFAALGRQAELNRSAGKESQYTLDQLLAAAVTGWVLGPTAAEASPGKAERLWFVRERILQIQRTVAPVDRSRLTADLAKSSELTVDEIARTINMLPPPDSAWAGPPGTVADRQASQPFSGHPAARYRLQMPAEYNANRAYPLLIVLPNVGQSIEDAMAPWRLDAERFGYILAAVEWGAGRSAYEYRPEDHAAVTDSLHDIKRILSVDTDRVALAGFGEGANMAYDVGLSHPDLFAGVVPINGRPRAFISVWYWRHAQALPFYIVMGEHSGAAIREWTLKLFDRWAGKGYSSLLVMYKGRPVEFFTGEVPTIFDWLSRKKRSAGFPELGRSPNSGSNGEEYHTYRTTDNHFYWASTDQVGDKFLLTDFFKQNVPTPAAVQATIRDANQVTVFTRGLKQVTLWFGRVFDAQTGSRDMIDFSQPIKITLNNRTTWTNGGKPLTPKLETLIEDFYQRNDRRRLFLARVDFSNIQ